MLDLIHAYENYLTKVKQASANTISSYMRDIRQFSSWLKSTRKLMLLMLHNRISATIFLIWKTKDEPEQRCREISPV